MCAAHGGGAARRRHLLIFFAVGRTWPRAARRRHASAPLVSPSLAPVAEKAMLAAAPPASAAVEEWLITVHLGCYFSAVKEYGFDSLGALRAVSEQDVIEMTEDPTVQMKKPHRRLFVSEWKTLCGLSAHSSTAVDGRHKKQKIDKARDPCEVLLSALTRANSMHAWLVACVVDRAVGLHFRWQRQRRRGPPSPTPQHQLRQLPPLTSRHQFPWRQNLCSHRRLASCWQPATAHPRVLLRI